MRVVVRAVSWVLAVAVVAVVAVAWFRPAPELDAEQASDVAVDALAAAGHDARVVEPPVAGTHEREDGDTVDAWFVSAEVDVEGTTETIELRVQESAGRLVFIDDRIGPDDTGRLLTDEEFQRVGRYEDETTTRRWVLENGLGSAGAALIVVTCLVLARRTDILWSDR